MMWNNTQNNLSTVTPIRKSDNKIFVSKDAQLKSSRESAYLRQVIFFYKTVLQTHYCEFVVNLWTKTYFKIILTKLFFLPNANTSSYNYSTLAACVFAGDIRDNTCLWHIAWRHCYFVMSRCCVHTDKTTEKSDEPIRSISGLHSLGGDNNEFADYSS